MPQKSKSSKVSSKKGNYVKNPAPDEDPQKLADAMRSITEQAIEIKDILSFRIDYLIYLIIRFLDI